MRWIAIAILGSAIVGCAVEYARIQRQEKQVQSRIDCIKNLRWIAGAKAILAHEKGIKAGTVVTTEEVAAYIVDGWPKCPADGRYAVNPIATNPTCTIPGHSLSE